MADQFLQIRVTKRLPLYQHTVKDPVDDLALLACLFIVRFVT